MMRKIAFNGLRGKLKQVAVLITTLTLSFLFVTTSILLLSTSHVNYELQKKMTFGDWSIVYVEADEEKKKELEEEEAIAYNRILGIDKDFGLIGSANNNFFQMANLKLLSGRLPQNLDEIVVTENRLSFFEDTPVVGDTYNVLTKISLPQSDQYLGKKNTNIWYSMNQVYGSFYDHWDIINERVSISYKTSIADTLDLENNLIQEEASKLGISLEEAQKRVIEKINRDYLMLKEVLHNKPASKEQAIIYLNKQEKKCDNKDIESIINDSILMEYYISKYGNEEKAKNIIRARTIDYYLTAMEEETKVRRKQTEVEGTSGTILRTVTDTVEHTISNRELADLSHFGKLLRDNELPSIEKIVNTQSYEIFMYREMKLVGIISNYNDTWDGPNREYPTALVIPQTGEQIIEGCLHLSKLPINRSYDTPYNLFTKITGSPQTFVDNMRNPKQLFPNNLGYVSQGRINEKTISKLLLALIGLFTVFALYRITLVQLKKRRRNLALLRAIGATNSQLKSLMLWEAIYLLLVALPLGLVSGLLISYLVVWLNLATTSQVVPLYVDWQSLLIGLFFTSVMALLGLFLPLRHLNTIPLRGRIQDHNNKKMFKARLIMGENNYCMQSLHSINKRHNYFIRKQRLLNVILHATMLLILLSSMLIIHVSFENYRNQITHMGMPDLELELPYQLSGQGTMAIMNEITSISGVENAEYYLEGEKSFLWFQGIEKNKLYTHFISMLPEDRKLDFFGTSKQFHMVIDRYRTSNENEEEVSEQVNQLAKKSMVVDLYGFGIHSGLLDKIKPLLPKDFNWERFNSGDSVIILSPSYVLFKEEPSEIVNNEILRRFTREELLNGVFKFTDEGAVSYDPRITPYMQIDPTFNQVKNIVLITESGWMYGPDNIRDMSVYYHEFDVAAILNNLPLDGIWPLSKTVQGPVVLGSPYLISKCYPNKLRPTDGLNVRDYIEQMSPTAYGKTWIQVRLNDLNDENALAVRKIANSNNFIVQSPYIQKQELYNKGFRTSLIIGLLALALLLIALQILSSSFKGRLEVERERIGILQSLGVTGKEYRMNYLLDAIREVLKAILITHLILALAVTLYILIKGMYLPFMQELTLLFDAYPWKYHVLLTLLYGIFAVLVAYLPLGSILKRKPVENIRSLN